MNAPSWPLIAEPFLLTKPSLWEERIRTGEEVLTARLSSGPLIATIFSIFGSLKSLQNPIDGIGRRGIKNQVHRGGAEISKEDSSSDPIGRRRLDQKLPPSGIKDELF